MNQDEYVRTVLRHYLSLPETADTPSRQDLDTARYLHARGVEIGRIREAMLLASSRRIRRDPSLPPLSPIRSLAYFSAVLMNDPELREPLPPEYVHYIENIVRNEKPGQLWREMADAS